MWYLVPQVRLQKKHKMKKKKKRLLELFTFGPPNGSTWYLVLWWTMVMNELYDRMQFSLISINA
jgi:hypothetical protein